jgi:hypothetical protein
MKNILIPSDFSSQSLECVKVLLHELKNERFNILLVHPLLMPDSMIELMLIARQNEEEAYVSEDFRRWCRQLESKHQEQIHSIRIRCFYGDTPAVFKNFLEANRIDLVVYPEHYQYRKLSRKSVDPPQLIQNCGRKIMIVTKEMVKKETMSFPRMYPMSYEFSLN